MNCLFLAAFTKKKFVFCTCVFLQEPQAASNTSEVAEEASAAALTDVDQTEASGGLQAEEDSSHSEEGTAAQVQCERVLMHKHERRLQR